MIKPLKELFANFTIFNHLNSISILAINKAVRKILKKSASALVNYMGAKEFVPGAQLGNFERGRRNIYNKKDEIIQV